MPPENRDIDKNVYEPRKSVLSRRGTNLALSFDGGWCPAFRAGPKSVYPPPQESRRRVRRFSFGEFESMFENRPDWLKLVDEESGLYNRLFLIHHLSEAFARSVRYGTPLSCLLIQAKWWRRLDEIEQSADAAAAHKLAQFLLLNVRTGDILGRWTRVPGPGPRAPSEFT